MNRITIDIDDKSAYLVGYALMELQYRLGDPIILEVKNSRAKGYHITYWHSKKISKKKEWFIRAKAGDDPKRIAWEKTRGKGVPRNVLFTDKKRRVKRNE